MPRKKAAPVKEKEELTSCSVLLESPGFAKYCVVKVLIGETLLQVTESKIVRVLHPMKFEWNPAVNAFVVRDAIVLIPDSSAYLLIDKCAGLTDLQLMDYKTAMYPKCKAV